MRARFPAIVVFLAVTLAMGIPAALNWTGVRLFVALAFLSMTATLAAVMVVGALRAKDRPGQMRAIDLRGTHLWPRWLYEWILPKHERS